MSETPSTMFCPVCRTEIQLVADENAGNGNAITGSTILKGAGVAVAIPCVVATLAGFGALGIAGSSAAAVWQASIGNVAAGSAFATLQSIGATGGFYSGMAYGGTAFGAGKWWESRNKNKSEQQEEEGTDGGESSGKEGKGRTTKDGNGENSNSDSDTNDQNQFENVLVNLTCPSCGRWSFTIAMPASTSNAPVDD